MGKYGRLGENGFPEPLEVFLRFLRVFAANYAAQVINRNSWAWVRLGWVGITRTLKP